jgi:transposase InsO family protein
LGVLLQDKSKTQGTLKSFFRRAQNEFELKVKKIRSENGSEFNNLQVEEYLEEEGIKHEFSAPYTPQQNGVVERKNRTLIDMERMMLGEYKTPEQFWSEAVNTACHAKRTEGATVGFTRKGRRSSTGQGLFMSGGAPDCPMCHSTEDKNCLPNGTPTAPSFLGAIKETPRRMEHHTKHSLNILRCLDFVNTHLDHCD